MVGITILKISHRLTFPCISVYCIFFHLDDGIAALLLPRGYLWKLHYILRVNQNSPALSCHLLWILFLHGLFTV